MYLVIVLVLIPPIEYPFPYSGLSQSVMHEQDACMGHNNYLHEQQYSLPTLSMAVLCQFRQ